VRYCTRLLLAPSRRLAESAGLLAWRLDVAGKGSVLLKLAC
jgi:hypothetical protein